MAKHNQATTPDLSTYKFDTSKYIELNWGVVRDASTGSLVKRGDTVVSKTAKKRA